MCALADPQPANHQEIELSAITDSPLDTEREEDRRAQGIASRFADARTQKNSQISNTVTFDSVSSFLVLLCTLYRPSLDLRACNPSST